MSKFQLTQPETKEYKSKTFRLPVELLNTLDKRAQEKNLSLNQAVIQCLEYAIEAMDAEE